MIDLTKITTNGKALYLAYDQGMEHGPSDFNDESVDPNHILDIGVKGGFNAVIFQRGIAEKYYTGTEFAEKIPLILKLNGKTNLTDNEPYAPLLCTAREAQDLGATAVGYTIYVGSSFESQMISDFVEVVRQAHEKGIPVIAWMYTRGRAIEGKDQAALTAYGARMGLELGADIIKIKYPGSPESLSWAVKAAGVVKVVVSGGPKLADQELLQIAKTTISSGAIGMAVGRNIWQHENPVEIAKKLKEIIFAS